MWHGFKIEITIGRLKLFVHTEFEDYSCEGPVLPNRRAGVPEGQAVLKRYRKNLKFLKMLDF